MFRSVMRAGLVNPMLRRFSLGGNVLLAAGRSEMGTPAWIAALGVLGTWLIFVAAIWGEKIRSSLFKPRLFVKLDNPRGVSIPETTTTFGAGPGMTPQVVQQYTRSARYYYLSVSNVHRWPLAHDVRILMTRLERPDPDGAPTTVWSTLKYSLLHGQLVGPPVWIS
jgi:hypothetical protein